MSLKKAILLIIIIVLIDQISKIYIKTHFMLNDEVRVFDWFKIYFIENPGMAWGTKISDFVSFISDRTAKTILTIFRIIAVFFIGYWLVDAVKRNSSRILIIGISLIFAGALGNIIDSVFYGLLFSNSSFNEIAVFLPKEGGYETVLHGSVVDMLSFPIWQGKLPDWVPFKGGQNFIFFEPVFNIADVAISTGVGSLLIFNKKAFRDA